MSMADVMETIENYRNQKIVVRERPILMSAPMVRAILYGSKTQTRRIVKPQPEMTGQINAFTHFATDAWLWEGGPALQRVGYGAPLVHTDLSHMIRAVLKVCPYGQKSDRLWCKETFYDSRLVSKRCPWTYRATTSVDEDLSRDFAWKPAIFMPRIASRLTLEIVDVRVDRLQDISPEDAIAEGVETITSVDHGRTDPVKAYRALWESINGAGSWAFNPFVFVIEFRRIKP